MFKPVAAAMAALLVAQAPGALGQVLPPVLAAPPVRPVPSLVPEPPSAPRADAALSRPVALTYDGEKDALSITATGTGKAVAATVDNPSSPSSAVFGTSNGKGAGVGASHTGTAGPAGRFDVAGARNANPALLARTAGTGSALQAVVSKARSNAPAIHGQNISTDAYGTGVLGEGAVIGVQGTVSSTGPANYYGVIGTVFNSEAAAVGYGVYGGAAGPGVSYGVYGTGSIGVFGQGAQYGIYGYAASNTTAYAGYFQGANGNAGYFQGNAVVTGDLAVGTLSYLSDANAKTGFEAVDADRLLEGLGGMEITRWAYASDPGVRHVGPTAQAFRAAFGLGGDDTRIGASDALGVSMAAIQSLHRQLQQSDDVLRMQRSKVEELNAQVQAQQRALERMQRLFDERLSSTSARGAVE